MNDFLNHFKNNKRDLINLIFLIILVISLPFAFKLAKERQLFSPKASNNAIEVVIPGGSDIQRVDDNTIKTTNPDIQLNITSPLENDGQSFNLFNLVGNVYAQEGVTYDLGKLLTLGFDASAAGCSSDNTTLIIKKDATKNVNCSDKNKTQGKDAVCGSTNKGYGCYEKLPKAAAPAPQAPAAKRLENKTPADGSTFNLNKDSDSITFTWGEGDPKITKYKFILYRGTFQNSVSGGQIKKNNCGDKPTSLDNVNKALLYCEWDITNKTFTLKKGDFDQDSNEKVYTWFIQGFDAGNTSVDGSLGNTIKVKVGDSTAPAPATAVQPKNGQPIGEIDLSGKNKIAFNWSKLTDATRYRIFVAKTSGDNKADAKDNNCKPDDMPGFTDYYLCRDGISKDASSLELDTDLFENNVNYVWWYDVVGTDGKVLKNADGSNKSSDGSYIKFTNISATAAAPVASPAGGAPAAGGGAPTPQTAEAISIACRNRAVNDPNWCLGYPIQCEETGVTWYYGGKKVRDANGNTACEYNSAWTCGAFKLNTDGSPASTLGCTKPWPPVSGAGGQNGGVPAGDTPPAPAAGQGGVPAPARPAPGEGDSDKVTLCGTEMSMAEARSAVGLSGGDRATVSDSYLKKFCPGSQNNCSLEPNFSEIVNDATPNGYIWVANCNRACLRNNSTGNDKDLLIDPNPNDPAACPKNYNDFSVNPKTSNWCYGFAGTGENTNRCMVLWSKEKYQALKSAGKSPFDLGSGTPGGSTGGTRCPAGFSGPGCTTPMQPAPASGSTWNTPSCDTSGKFLGCNKGTNPICSDYGATTDTYNRCNSLCTVYKNPANAANKDQLTCAALSGSTPSAATINWIKASCTSNVFAGCTVANGPVCGDFGLGNGQYKDWNKAEYDRCVTFCAVYKNPANAANKDAKACEAMGVAVTPPAGDGTKQVISGTATYANCSHGVFPGAQIIVRDEITGQEAYVYTGADGKYTTSVVSKGNRYIVFATANTNTGAIITHVETSDSSSATYKNQKDGTAANCAGACDFKLTVSNCNLTPQRAVRTAQATTTQYLLTENRNDFTNLAIQWTSYPAGGITNLPYKINGVGQHTLFLKFKDDQGNIIDNNGAPYTFYVELLAPAAGAAPVVQPRVLDTAPTCTTTDRSCCPATPVPCASNDDCTSGKYNWCYAGVCIDRNYKENDSNPGKGLGSCTGLGVGSTAPSGNSGEPASCKTTTVCSQSVTGNSPSDCVFSCDSNGNAKYDCTQSDNRNCVGTVYCGGENNKCNNGGGGAQPAACNATETVCGQSVYDHYTLRCTNGQAFYDSYQTSSRDNCQGTIQCEADNYKCEGI